MKISVIVKTYNWPEALSLVLKSLNEQKTKYTFEVIIADDGSNEKTQKIIESFKEKSRYHIKHIWHDDDGYRLSKIVNKALIKTCGDYIILIDGDCVCPRKFIEKHGKLAEKNYFVAGNRVLISERYIKETLNYNTEPSNFYFKNLIKIKMQKNCNKISTLIPIPLAGLRKIFPYKWKKAKGCNLGIWRNDLLNIKGFDECYEGWGYEDSDMVIRLMNSGVKRKSGKFAVTVIHLGHPILSRSNEKQNFDQLMQTLKSKLTLPKLGMK